jgi:hypothetical protein
VLKKIFGTVPSAAQTAMSAKANNDETATHRTGSQEQEAPHWQVLAVFRLPTLRFFGWCLRFDFIVIDS